jgi:hypothetical protein
MKPKTVGRVGGHDPQTGQLNPDLTATQGIASGSIVMTLDGEMPVEFLNSGDRIVTRDTGMSVIRSVRSFQTTCRAVRLRAGSLGHTRPDRDVVLSADQHVLIRDWRAEALFGGKRAMVPASRLIDGEFVTDLGEIDMLLYQIEFDSPHVIYVDGLELYSTQPAVLSDTAILRASNGLANAKQA